MVEVPEAVSQDGHRERERERQEGEVVDGVEDDVGHDRLTWGSLRPPEAGIVGGQRAGGELDQDDRETQGKPLRLLALERTRNAPVTIELRQDAAAPHDDHV